MRIVVTGATGFIGKSLTEALMNRSSRADLSTARHEPSPASRSELRGDEVIILSRKAIPARGTSKIRYVRWNPEDSTSIVNEIDGSDAVVNLAGKPIVGKRWSSKQKEKILSSRVHATQVIANSIKKTANKPKVLINASAVGFYGPRGNELLTEEARSGEGFLAETCKAWEAHAIRVEDFDVRVVRLRTGIVLDKEGGALLLMLPPFKMFMGGWLGNGNQWMSWITREDLVRLILFCLDHQTARGAINAVAPQAVTNKAFSLVLAQVLKRPCFMPVPAFALRILLGEMSKMLLTGQRVVPKKAEELGFAFHHPEIRHALESILD